MFGLVAQLKRHILTEHLVAGYPRPCRMGRRRRECRFPRRRPQYQQPQLKVPPVQSLLPPRSLSPVHRSLGHPPCHGRPQANLFIHSLLGNKPDVLLISHCRLNSLSLLLLYRLFVHQFPGWRPPASPSFPQTHFVDSLAFVQYASHHYITCIIYGTHRTIRLLYLLLLWATRRKPSAQPGRGNRV